MNLDISLNQKQVLNQRMQLSVKILQMNSLDLEQHILNEALENPLIELDAPYEDEDPAVIHLKKLEWLESMDESSLYAANYHYEPEEKEQPIYEKKTADSLADVLLMQLPALRLAPELEHAVRYLIDSLDENGYLPADMEGLQPGSDENNELFNEGLAILQQMEPAGVGARNLRECLLIQARQLDEPSPVLLTLIEQHLDVLAKNQLEKLSKTLNISLEQVKEARRRLLELNPKPGNGFAPYDAVPYIRPDIFIVHFEGEFQIILNDYAQPRITFNNQYHSMVKEQNSEAAPYLREQLNKAEWLVTCIQQRKNTIMKCAEKILEWQILFFRKGPGHMASMTLADIASQLDIHPSTVSRAVNGKYLQCQWGVFAINDFFSRPINEDRQEQSQDMAINLIRRIIAEEDKRRPYSDQQITDLLIEQGISIARRTVAKYRESVGVPTAAKRKVF